MDDLFRKLGSGANFNIKRFKNDANSLKVYYNRFNFRDYTLYNMQ